MLSAFLHFYKLCMPKVIFLYCSFHTTSGYGFEAFFTEEDILVVSVCIKKEFHTIAVVDAPISDNEWVGWATYPLLFEILV